MARTLNQLPELLAENLNQNAIILVKQLVDGKFLDHHMLASQFLSNTLSSNDIGTSVGSIIRLVQKSGSNIAALPAVSGFQLTDLEEAVRTANSSNTGLVRLSDSTNSSQDVTAGFAATPKAVRAVAQQIANAVSKSGDQMSGNLRFENNAGVTARDSSNVARNVAKVNPSDVMEIGSSSLVTRIFGSNVDDVEISDGTTVSKIVTQNNFKTLLTSIGQISVMPNGVILRNSTGTELLRVTDTQLAYKGVVIPLTGTSGISDAPSDGKQYARRDGGWVEVESGGGGGAPEVPTDNKVYGFRNDGTATTPVEVLPERAQPSFDEVLTSIGGGIPVAPPTTTSGLSFTVANTSFSTLNQAKGAGLNQSLPDNSYFELEFTTTGDIDKVIVSLSLSDMPIKEPADLNAETVAGAIADAGLTQGQPISGTVAAMLVANDTGVGTNGQISLTGLTTRNFGIEKKGVNTWLHHSGGKTLIQSDSPMSFMGIAAADWDDLSSVVTVTLNPTGTSVRQTLESGVAALDPENLTPIEPQNIFGDGSATVTRRTAGGFQVSVPEDLSEFTNDSGFITSPPADTNQYLRQGDQWVTYNPPATVPTGNSNLIKEGTNSEIRFWGASTLHTAIDEAIRNKGSSFAISAVGAYDSSNSLNDGVNTLSGSSPFSSIAKTNTGEYIFNVKSDFSNPPGAARNIAVRVQSSGVPAVSVVTKSSTQITVTFYNSFTQDNANRVDTDFILFWQLGEFSANPD